MRAVDGFRNAEFASLMMRAASAASAPITCVTRVRGARGSSRTFCTRIAISGSEGRRTSPTATSIESLRMTASRSDSPARSSPAGKLFAATEVPWVRGSITTLSAGAVPALVESAANIEGQVGARNQARLSALLGVLQNDSAPVTVDSIPFLDLFQGSKAGEAGELVMQAAISDAWGLNGDVGNAH